MRPIMPVQKAVSIANRTLLKLFLISARRLVSLLTTVWAPVPTLYMFAMRIRFSIVSERAWSGVIPADIHDLKKYWERNCEFASKCLGEDGVTTNPSLSRVCAQKIQRAAINAKIMASIMAAIRQFSNSFFK